jgi:hypothetical protein
MAWLWRALKLVLTASAVVVVSFLALAFLAGCAFASHDDRLDCENIRVSGATEYVMAYRKADGWYLSAPGDGSRPVEPPKILKLDQDAQLGVVLFLDSKGKTVTRGYNWHIHGDSGKRFCLR